MTKPRHFGGNRPGNTRRLEERHAERQKPAQTPPEDVPAPVRERVKELDARGYTRTQIAAVTRLPHATVATILDTKATPKKPAGGRET